MDFGAAQDDEYQRINIITEIWRRKLNRLWNRKRTMSAEGCKDRRSSKGAWGQAEAAEICLTVGHLFYCILVVLV
jgi:hypothetical protein